MDPFALILCGGPAHTALVLGALSSATDLLHVPCPRKQLPDIGALSASALERTPLLVFSGVRQSVYLTYLTDALLEQGIESMSVWVESRRPSAVDAGFHPFDLEFSARLEIPRASPLRIAATLTPRLLASASELGLREGYCLELPLGDVTLCTPVYQPLNEDLDALTAARKGAEQFCKTFNAALPSHCERCGKPVMPGLPCFSCGLEPAVRRQTVLADEHGYHVVAADAHDQVNARFIAIESGDDGTVPTSDSLP